MVREATQQKWLEQAQKQRKIYKAKTTFPLELGTRRKEVFTIEDGKVPADPKSRTVRPQVEQMAYKEMNREVDTILFRAEKYVLPLFQRDYRRNDISLNEMGERTPSSTRKLIRVTNKITQMQEDGATIQEMLVELATSLSFLDVIALEQLVAEKGFDAKEVAVRRQTIKKAETPKTRKSDVFATKAKNARASVAEPEPAPAPEPTPKPEPKHVPSGINTLTPNDARQLTDWANKVEHPDESHERELQDFINKLLNANTDKHELSEMFKNTVRPALSGVKPLSAIITTWFNYATMGRQIDWSRLGSRVKRAVEDENDD